MSARLGERLATVVASLAAVAATGVLAGCGAEATAGEGGDAGTRTVEVGVRYSRFAPDRLTVPAGTTVRFVVRNDDPIDHELIVGDDAVHDRHEDGTEAEHGAVPGEVSVPAGEIRTTEYRFDEPGTVVFACHLPGHLAYGMRGVVTVVG